ncbi:hypothetical protein STRNTR1_2254 [Stenotrophomonas maltophilia]|nr:hypothetical protein STRNTR1_2254 [Stenotrophomonas maltophilia]
MEPPWRLHGGAAAVQASASRLNVAARIHAISTQSRPSLHQRSLASSASPTASLPCPLPTQTCHPSMYAMPTWRGVRLRRG